MAAAACQHTAQLPWAVPTWTGEYQGVPLTKIYLLIPTGTPETSPLAQVSSPQPSSRLGAGNKSLKSQLCPKPPPGWDSVLKAEDCTDEVFSCHLDRQLYPEAGTKC